MLYFTCNQTQIPKSFKGSEQYFPGNSFGENSGGVGSLQIKMNDTMEE